MASFVRSVGKQSTKRKSWTRNASSCIAQSMSLSLNTERLPLKTPAPASRALRRYSAPISCTRRSKAGSRGAARPAGAAAGAELRTGAGFLRVKNAICGV